MSEFSVKVGVCAHRGLKLSVFKSLWELCKCPGIKISILPMDGDALISRSRSIVATHFLEKCTEDLLMFIDDDVVITPFDATKIMYLAHEKKLDIVGAAYVTKSKRNPGFAVMPLFNDGNMRFGKHGGLYEMRNTWPDLRDTFRIDANGISQDTPRRTIYRCWRRSRA